MLKCLPPFIKQVRSPNLDRDEESSYQVEIIVYDSGNPQQSSSTTVTVQLTDVNDKPPKFDEDTIQPFDVPEDQPIGSGGSSLKIV